MVQVAEPMLVRSLYLTSVQHVCVGGLCAEMGSKGALDAICPRWSTPWTEGGAESRRGPPHDIGPNRVTGPLLERRISVRIRLL